MSSKINPEKPEEIRREVVEIVQRRRRALPGYRGINAPAPAQSKEQEAQRLVDEGHALLEQGQLAEALLRADTAIGYASPGSEVLADAWALHGELRVRQGNLQAARASFRKALAINPAHLPARVAMADLLQKIQAPDQAIALYLETIPLIQDEQLRARLRVNLAQAYRAAGRPDAARRVMWVDGGVRPIRPVDRVRLALTLLLPERPGDWVLLLVMALAALATIGSGESLAAAVFSLSLIAYTAIQLWRTWVH